MSYILEALKKVEQKRAREDLPALLTFSGEAEPERRRRAVWPYFLIAALFLNALFLVRWLAPSKPDEHAGTQAPAQVEQSQSAIDDKAGREESRVTSPASPKKEPVPRKGVGPSASAAAPEREAPEAPSPPVQKAHTPANTSVQDTVPPEKKHPLSDRVYGLNELPPEIRSALPEFKVSGHAYGPDPRTRVARVNEKILQEGQSLSSGLRVEEIVQEGIILSYQGYRFSVGINNR